MVPDDSDVIYLKDADKIERLQDRNDVIDTLYNIVKDQYPKAFDALFEVYAKSAEHKFLMMRRFIKCNFSKHDSIIDLDTDILNFENIFCPLKGECKYDHIICNPEFNTKLTDTELQVMALIAQNERC